VNSARPVDDNASDAHRPVTKALLSAIVQAAETTEKIEFASLEFTEVLVEVGSGRAVRIGWRSVNDVAPVAAPATEARPPTFSQSSFFARPEAATPAASAVGDTRRFRVRRPRQKNY
jgi:hypothetical protein